MVENFKIIAKNVDGTQMDIPFDDTNEIIKYLYTDDFGGATLNTLELEVKNESGDKVRIVIPYEKKGGCKKVILKINPAY
jgi:hypothetical protein